MGDAKVSVGGIATGVPIGDGSLSRSAGRVTIDGVAHDIWFESATTAFVPDAAPGNAWAVAALPVAFLRGGKLRIEAPVDAELARNLTALSRQWVAWYRRGHAVEIAAPTIETKECRGRRTGLFFSGGVDSYFSLLVRKALSAPSRPDELIAIGGYDIPITRPTEIERHFEAMRDTAREFDLTFTSITTNLRRLPLAYGFDWGPVSHGAALVAAAMALGPRYDRLLVSSTNATMDAIPWGSHPSTDPLLSASGMATIHVGAEANRVEKIVRIAEDNRALRRLHVCWIAGSSANCGRCAKCLKTMFVLDVIGARERAVSFPWDQYSDAAVAACGITSPTDVIRSRELVAFARANGRDAVAIALEATERRYRAYGRRVLRLKNGWRSAKASAERALDRWAMTRSILQRARPWIRKLKNRA